MNERELTEQHEIERGVVPPLNVYGFQLWSSQRRNVVLFSEW